VLVETTLEVRDGKIVRQVDAVAKVALADAATPDRLPGSDGAIEKEEY
jgi:hypothetical protein